MRCAALWSCSAVPCALCGLAAKVELPMVRRGWQATRAHPAQMYNRRAIMCPLTAGKDLPVVAIHTLLPRPGQGGGEDSDGSGAPALVHPRNMTTQLLAANGFSPHRQARLKLIHAACCRLAWLGGGPAAAHAAAALATGEAGRMFVVTPVPGTEPGSRSRLDMQQVDLSQDAAIAG